MELERKQDLSIYYWLKDLFSASPFIHIEDGFPLTSLKLPSVSVERDTIDSVPFELGNRRGRRVHLWSIDTFAENKSQRDEFAYKIFNNIEAGIPVYDYDLGFPPEVTPTQIGTLVIEETKLKIIQVFPELVSDLYWRSEIIVLASYEQI